MKKGGRTPVDVRDWWQHRECMYENWFSETDDWVDNLANHTQIIHGSAFGEFMTNMGFEKLI